MTTSTGPHFDFNIRIDRRGTASKKWQSSEQADIVPMWVADMDIPAPPAVRAALEQMATDGLLGYGTVTDDLVQAFLNWCERHYGWTPDADWLVWVPGVVPAMHVATEAWLDRTEGLATQTPVYPPIYHMGQVRQRPMQWLDDNSGLMSPASLPDQLAGDLKSDTRALILCNPQNPTGQIYTRTELEAIAAVAAERDLLIISDEIWADLILDADCRHTPFASLGPAAAERSITLLAPSKTFNIAGLCCAVAIIPDASLRARFQQQAQGLLPDMNYAGLRAAQAAYSGGGPWLEALRAHLCGNLERVETWLRDFPAVGYQRPQATYVVWLDMRQALPTDPVDAFLRAGVALSDGADFGAPGFVRLNIGCPQAQLETALQRMSQALGG